MDTQVLLQQEGKAMIDQGYLLVKLAEIEDEWIEATEGEMDEVTLNLGLLFNDFRRLVLGKVE